MTLKHAHTENWYKTALVKQARDCGAYARRIEDQYSVGVLDMVFVVPGRPVVFAEGKRIMGKKFGPTPRQGIEGRAIDVAGIGNKACSLLIGWDVHGLMYICPWLDVWASPQCKQEAVAADVCFKQLPKQNYYQTLMEYLG